MKKETIFKHEINESIQANAAMNCLKNRNNSQQMNESKFLADILRMALFLLKPLIKKIVQSLITKFGAKLTGRQVAKMVIKNVSNGKTLMKISKKVGQTWTELPAELKQEIAKTAINTFKEIRQSKQPQQPQLATQEQEETSEFDARFEFRKDLRELASPAAKKAYMIIRKQYGDGMWRQLYMDDCDERGLIDMLNMYAEKGLKPQQIVNKMMGVREDEETVDYAQLAEDVVASYRGRLSNMDEKERVNFISTMVMKKMGKSIDTLTPQEKKEIISAAKHSMWYVSEQEESTYNEKEAIAKQVMANYNPDTDEYEDPTVWLRYAIQEHIGKLFLKMPKKEVKAWQKAIEETVDEYEFEKQHPAHYEDADEDNLQSQLANAWDEGMEDDYVPYENKFDETHKDIVDNLISAVEYYFDTDDDVNGFYHHDYTEDQLGKAVEKVLDKYGDFPSSNNFDKCYAWTKKHVEELMKILETGHLENPYEGHPEFDFSEQEELPQMERHDMILTLTQYLDESWIDGYDEDGDLEELYYAVAKVLDKTGDYPASTSWEDCKPWCEKHWDEVEETFLGGGF